MKEPLLLVAQCLEALAEGAPLAPVEERPQYASHTVALERLAELLSTNSSSQAVAAVMARERRAFGWSFLSGSHGERVEAAFHALASVLAQRVLKDENDA